MLIARKALPSQADLFDMFEYDETEGTLRWKARGNLCWDRKNAGKVAGRRNKSVEISIHGERWQAHRIIWKMAYGDEPCIVDHANGNTFDNRLANLRAATPTQNMGNKRKVVGASGLKGVRPNGSKWGAYIRKGGTFCALGKFESKDDAARAYDNAAVTEFGEFACTNAALGLVA